MANDETKMAALQTALGATGAADAELVGAAIDFLNAYADVGVWDAGSSQFSYIDASRARLLAQTLRISSETRETREKEARSCRRPRRR